MMIFLANITSSEQPNVTTTQKPPFRGDEAKYLIAPIVVVVLVMLLSLLVYCMAKRRKMIKLRREIARLYNFDSKNEEWESLNSFENPYYSSGEYTDNVLSRNNSFTLTTNL